MKLHLSLLAALMLSKGALGSGFQDLPFTANNNANDQFWTQRDDIETMHSKLFRAATDGHVGIVINLISLDEIRIDEQYQEIIVNLLQKHNANINTVMENRETLLYVASKKGYMRMVEALCNVAGIDVNKANNNGNTPLLIASWSGKLESVQALCNAGADVNQEKMDDKITPLLVAITMSYVEIVDFLLSVPKIDVNKADQYGETPFFVALRMGNLDMVKKLLSSDKIKIDEKSQEIIVNLLTVANQKMESGVWGEFHQKLKRTHIELVEILLKRGVKMDLGKGPLNEVILPEAENDTI